MSNDGIKYNKIAPEGSFIYDYMQQFVNVETSYSYDFWCACWILSNVLGRGITVPRPMAPVHLNLYTILCADAGITRKSTAVRHATRLLNAYKDSTGHNTDDEGGNFASLSGTVTPESLDTILANLTANGYDSHVAIAVSELVSFLGKDRYTAGMPGKLTDLYDCPARSVRSTASRGELIAKNVYITFLAASTPSWLVRAVNPDVVEGGFTSRCLFVIEERPKALIAWPEEPIGNGDTTERLVYRLHQINARARDVTLRYGGIRPNDRARAIFSDWYSGRALSSDPFAASFQAREDHHILRLSAILAVSDDTWEIQYNHVLHAIKIINHIRRAGMALFGAGIQSTKMYSLVDRIRHALISAGRSGLSQTAVTAISRKHGSRDDQSSCLAIMHEMQLVQKFEVRTGESGRPITMWRATKALAAPTALETVVEMLTPQGEG